MKKFIGTTLIISTIIGTICFMAGRFTAPVKTQTVFITQQYTAEDAGTTPPVEISRMTNSATVDKTRWVTVKNPAGIRSCNGFFEFNETGVIDRGGTLTIVKETGDQYLVSYSSIKGKESGGGTLLPQGALFFISKEEFHVMTSNFIATEKQHESERDSVIALLKK